MKVDCLHIKFLLNSEIIKLKAVNPQIKATS